MELQGLQGQEPLRGRKRTLALLVSRRKGVAESSDVNMVAGNLCLLRAGHQTALCPSQCLLFTKDICDEIMRPEVLFLPISLPLL